MRFRGGRLTEVTKGKRVMASRADADNGEIKKKKLAVGQSD